MWAPRPSPKFAGPDLNRPTTPFPPRRYRSPPTEAPACLCPAPHPRAALPAAPRRLPPLSPQPRPRLGAAGPNRPYPPHRSAPFRSSRPAPPRPARPRPAPPRRAAVSGGGGAGRWEPQAGVGGEGGPCEAVGGQAAPALPSPGGTGRPAGELRGSRAFRGFVVSPVWGTKFGNKGRVSPPNPGKEGELRRGNATACSVESRFLPPALPAQLLLVMLGGDGTGALGRAPARTAGLQP